MLKATKPEFVKETCWSGGTKRGISVEGPGCCVVEKNRRKRWRWYAVGIYLIEV